MRDARADPATTAHPGAVDREGDLLVGGGQHVTRLEDGDRTHHELAVRVLAAARPQLELGAVAEVEPPGALREGDRVADADVDLVVAHRVLFAALADR